MSNLQLTRSYLVGRKTLLEEQLQKIRESMSSFELECIELFEKVDTLLKSGMEKYQEEVDKLQLSIDLHQNMLTALDVAEDPSSAQFDLDIKRELFNMETVINLTDERVKRMFTSKRPEKTDIIKKTVVENTRAVVASPGYVDPKVKEDFEQKLFRNSAKYTPYPDDYYVKSNGFINNAFVGECLYEYMRDHRPEMTVKEMAEWVKELFPKSADRWASIEKGIANIIQLHLKKDKKLAPASNGVWRVI